MSDDWKQIDLWRRKQNLKLSGIANDLAALGWTLVETNDGQWGARRIRFDEDADHCLVQDGEPEARGATPSILIATIKAFRLSRNGATT